MFRGCRRSQDVPRPDLPINTPPSFLVRSSTIWLGFGAGFCCCLFVFPPFSNPPCRSLAGCIFSLNGNGARRNRLSEARALGSLPRDRPPPHPHPAARPRKPRAPPPLRSPAAVPLSCKTMALRSFQSLTPELPSAVGVGFFFFSFLYFFFPRFAATTGGRLPLSRFAAAIGGA